ncbi:MAG: hypothetical protein N2748_02300 [candidate division WOR-3 bacterium]|nr:hypothetical protein [candidate division WOR-3 bacterium]
MRLPFFVFASRRRSNPNPTGLCELFEKIGFKTRLAINNRPAAITMVEALVIFIKIEAKDKVITPIEIISIVLIFGTSKFYMQLIRSQ